MKNGYSDHPALDFLDEEPTDPYVKMVQEELDTAESISAFSAQAQILGYRLAEEVDVELSEDDLILAEVDVEQIFHEYR